MNATPNEFDAWVFARVLADRPFPNELGLVSPPRRPLLTRLLRAPAGQRELVLHGQSGLRAEFLGAIRRADPDGSAPRVDWLIVTEADEDADALHCLGLHAAAFPEDLDGLPAGFN